MNIQMVDDLSISLKKDITSTQTGYVSPSWSSFPKKKYSIDVWKEGVILKTIPLDMKEYYVIGRNNAVCDITLANPTVSRVHCVIQFKDDGYAYMYDLKTAYGTFVNRDKIEPQKYIKIKAGDTFKIANSTKIFIVNCQEENEKDEVSKTKISENIHHLFNKKDDKIIINNVSNWGIEDNENEIYQYQHDAEQYDDNNDLNINELNTRTNLTPKQKTLLNKINQLLTEREHILKEKDDMKHMDYDADEDTVKKKIERKRYYFTKRLTEIKDSLTTLKQSLSESLKAIEDNQSRFNKKILKEINEEDEYYDMTKYQKQPEETSEVINYETLKATLERLIKEKQRLVDCQSKEAKVNKLADPKQKLEIDSLDQYFLDNTEEHHDTNIKNKLESLDEEIMKTEKLLDYVTPIHLKLKQQVDLKKNKIIPLKDSISQSTMPISSLSKSSNRKKESISDVLNKMNKIQHQAILNQQSAIEMEENDQMRNIDINENQDSVIQLDDDTLQKLKQYKNSLYQTEERNKEKKDPIENESNLFKEIIANIGKDTFEMANYPQISSRYDNEKKTKKQYKRPEFILPDEEEYLKDFTGNKRPRDTTGSTDNNDGNKMTYEVNDSINEVKGNWIEENISENPFNKYINDDN